MDFLIFFDFEEIVLIEFFSYKSFGEEKKLIEIDVIRKSLSESRG